MSIKITKCDNGAMLEHEYNDFYSNDIVTNRLVFNFDNGNLDGLVDLLYEIKDLVSDSTSRYDKERLVIVLDNGDKYEGEDKLKSCPLCLRDYEENNEED